MSIEPGEFTSEGALKVAIAKMYYLEELSKLQIAEQLEISRFKVARLLQAARAEGIVEVRIREEPALETDVAAALKERFGLLNCVVVPTPRSNRSDEMLRSALGEAAAKLLGQVLGERDILGIGWGRTIQEIIPHLPPLPRCPVVQLSGMTGAPDQNATEIVRRIASLTKGPAFPIYAPLLLPSPETADELRHMPGIAATFGMQERITVALLSIGSWNPPNSQLRVLPRGAGRAGSARTARRDGRCAAGRRGQPGGRARVRRSDPRHRGHPPAADPQRDRRSRRQDEAAGHPRGAEQPLRQQPRDRRGDGAGAAERLTPPAAASSPTSQADDSALPLHRSRDRVAETNLRRLPEWAPGGPACHVKV